MTDVWIHPNDIPELSAEANSERGMYVLNIRSCADNVRVCVQNCDSDSFIKFCRDHNINIEYKYD